jgi:hypothetical protein
MKIILALIFLSLFCLTFTSESNSLAFLETFAEPIKCEYQVYSMVWSAKYYNPVEKKKFFFNVPSSFSTEMTLDINNKSIFLNFLNWKNDMGNFKYLTDEKENINSSVFAPLINFSGDMTNVSVSFNFAKFPEFEISNLNIYQNSFAKSFQVKITKTIGDRLKNAVYFTFDFNKKAIDPNLLIKFEQYLESVRRK